MKKAESRKGMDARAAALLALARLEKGVTCQEAIAFARQEGRLPPLEKNLAAELFYGVCRARERLDYIMRKFLPKPDSLPPPLRDVIRIALYSLLYQDRIPPYAAVDAAVRAARAKWPRLAGVVNGFLRNAQRNMDALQSRQWYGDNLAGLAIYCGLPPLIANLWKNAYGEENAALLLRRSGARPWSGLLPAPGAGHEIRRALAAAASCQLDGGYCYSPGALPADAGALQEAGRVFFQSPASWHILGRLGLYKWQEPLWEPCAGFGGKTLALLFAGRNVALASDISAKRLGNLPPQCAKYGLRPPAVFLGDAACAPVRWHGNILLDAPCSGLGVLGRRPDIARGALPQKIASLRRIQSKILACCGRSLERGGKLAYVTCTLNPEENENAVRGFLAANPNFTLAAEWQTPHDHPWLDGMYGAVLERNY